MGQREKKTFVAQLHRTYRCRTRENGCSVLDSDRTVLNRSVDRHVRTEIANPTEFHCKNDCLAVSKW